MKAAKRRVAPRKKAPEIPESTWNSHNLLPDEKSVKTTVHLASHLFACGTHWMMREIELANLTSSNITFDSTNRTEAVVWRESKNDTEGASVTRTLQCICQGGCDLSCPYAVLETLVSFAALKGSKGAYLAFTTKGTRATKSDIVRSWKQLYDVQ